MTSSSAELKFNKRFLWSRTHMLHEAHLNSKSKGTLRNRTFLSLKTRKSSSLIIREITKQHRIIVLRWTIAELLMKAACYQFHQKTRQKTAKSAVGACAVSHTTYSAAVYAGKRKSFKQIDQISSRDLQSGYLIVVKRNRRWPPRTKTPSQSSFHCIHVNQQPFKSLPSAGLIQT